MLDIKALHVLQSSLRTQRKHQHHHDRRERDSDIYDDDSEIEQSAFTVNSGRMSTWQYYSDHHSSRMNGKV